MSSTRFAASGTPLNQNRYASSPEFAGARGINGMAVAARAGLIRDRETRALLWFIQWLSLRPGGLDGLKAGILETHPDRIGTPTMRRLKVTAASQVRGNELLKIHRELGLIEAHRADCSFYAGELKREFASKEAAGKELLEICTGRFLDHLEKFLVELCINPRLIIAPSEADESRRETYLDRARESFPDLQETEIEVAGSPYFENVIGALMDCKRLHEEKVRADFVLTAIGEKVWDALDHVLKREGMVVLEGFEGVGKTEAARAWCNSHPGSARFVSLNGITGKTNFFRAVAKALGIANGLAYKSNQLQARVEDFLIQTRLVLVIDEAHFLIEQRPRMYARPELLDWLDTVINAGVSVGLVSTPQLLKTVKQAAEQVGWNFRQWVRRCKRFEVLPEKNTLDDIKKVARKMLPAGSAAIVNLVAGYATLSTRDLSAVGDVIAEARILATEDGREEITFNDVDRAIKEILMPTDAAFAQRLKSESSRRSKPAAISEPVPIGEPAKEADRCLPASRATDSETLLPRQSFQLTTPKL